MTAKSNFTAADKATTQSCRVIEGPHRFIIGDQEIPISLDEGVIIEALMNHTPAKINTIANNDEGFNERYQNLMKKLQAVPIANEGGNGSVFYEDTITARDLFIEGDNSITFNHELARLVSREKFLSDQTLHSIDYKPSPYMR